MAKRGKHGGLSNVTFDKLHERNYVSQNLVKTGVTGGGFIGSVTSAPSKKVGA